MDAEFIKQQFLTPKLLALESGISLSTSHSIFRTGRVTETTVGTIYAMCPYMLWRWQAEQQRRRKANV